jgi:hypothetical protein
MAEFTSDPKFGSATFGGDVSDPTFSPDGNLLAAEKYGMGPSTWWKHLREALPG